MNVKNKYHKAKKDFRKYLDSRTHRSFQRTKRRDYVRQLKLPGYIGFTIHVAKTLWSSRKTFIILAITYALITVLLVGIASQDLYQTMSTTLATTSGDLFTGTFGELGKAGLLFLTSASGGLSQNLTESQQVYAGLILLMTWLTTVWLLRNIMAGHKVKVRDGLYNAGSPIVSTFLIALVFIVQLLPVGLALVAYSAASATGLLAGGVEAMLFWVAFGLLTLLSLYWITSTFFALIIVTIPGVYPMQALKTANDLIIGRRIRILLRLVWLFIITGLVWVLVMIPVIIIDMRIKELWTGTSWVPTIPITLLALSSITTIWVSSYVYLLYRKVVDNDEG